jgi:hypothetical protein
MASRPGAQGRLRPEYRKRRGRFVTFVLGDIPDKIW